MPLEGWRATVLQPPCVAPWTRSRTGRLERRLVGCDVSDYCAPSWLSAQQLRRSFLPYSWLLFFGDSDTRGLVLSLLQTLAEAGHSRSVAASTPALWLGNQTNTRHQQASRICHLDWSYQASTGLVRRARAVNCLESNSRRPDFGPVRAVRCPFVLHCRPTPLSARASARCKNTSRSKGIRATS